MSGAGPRIEDFFRRRYGREAIYLPSGRLALYVAFQEWLKPGDRILMSPVNDDVVFFTVLAAGLTPVLGPIDPSTGNLDPGAVDEDTWAGLRAVMTTNLYGIPDRMDILMERCGRHGLVLVEDACQAFDSVFRGERIGVFGPVAALSLTKHIDGVGGILIFSEAERRKSLAQRAEEVIRRRTLLDALGFKALCSIKDLADITSTRLLLRRLRRRLFTLSDEREGHRMFYDLGEVLRAGIDGGGLDRFERWVRVDCRSYRTLPPEQQVRKTLRRLESFEQNRKRRIEGARKLQDVHLYPSRLLGSHDFALFRVPLFVRNRETVASYLGRRGVSVEYIYDPPLDIYVPLQLAGRIPSPSETIHWSRDVLPIDPLQADDFLKLLNESPPLIPAWTSTGQS